MIIVKLMGGLGNQMFQYAAGKALATKHGVELLVDTSFLNANPNGAYTKRELELSVFSLSLKIAKDSELKKYASGGNRLQRLIRRVLPQLFKVSYFSEKGQCYQTEFMSLPPNTYLEGYWQNELYFSAIREQLLKDFSPKLSMPAVVESYYARIINCTSISLHVRRGDYVTVASAAEFHGLTGIEYYTAALNYYEKNLGAFEIFVFSDDISWCKNNLKHNNPITYVEHNLAAIWDMYLMTACKHHIIANSSFSWWAAWLDNKENSSVVMPRMWFKNATAEDLGIAAKNWLQL